jgi:hypothetical protein
MLVAPFCDATTTLETFPSRLRLMTKLCKALAVLMQCGMGHCLRFRLSQELGCFSELKRAGIYLLTLSVRGGKST